MEREKESEREGEGEREGERERMRERQTDRQKNGTVGHALQSSRTSPITILRWFDHYWMCSIAIHFTGLQETSRELISNWVSTFFQPV